MRLGYFIFRKFDSFYLLVVVVYNLVFVQVKIIVRDECERVVVYVGSECELIKEFMFVLICILNGSLFIGKVVEIDENFIG